MNKADAPPPVVAWVLLGIIGIGLFIRWQAKRDLQQRHEGYQRGVYQTALYYTCKGHWPSGAWQEKARDFVNDDWDCKMIDVIENSTWRKIPNH